MYVGIANQIADSDFLLWSNFLVYGTGAGLWPWLQVTLCTELGQDCGHGSRSPCVRNWGRTVVMTPGHPVYGTGIGLRPWFQVTLCMALG